MQRVVVISAPIKAPPGPVALNRKSYLLLAVRCDHGWTMVPNSVTTSYERCPLPYLQSARAT